MSSRRSEKRAQPERRKESVPFTKEMAALGIFAVIVLAGPLLFGAVDRLPQIGLLALLGVGILLQPPAIIPLSRWGNRLALAFVALLLFKEFAPANWFGDTVWRTTLTRDYSLPLLFTHHPEPARALDALLAGAVGVVWFLWVRRLAGERSHRAFLAWTLFAAAAVVAIVSFATTHPGSSAIYDGTPLARWTPGWSGFGPFPNRNHSADYFAMAAVLGCGCVTWSASRKNWLTFCGGLALLALVVIALLTTASRGGLIALGAGLAIYLLLCLCKVRTRRAIGAALGAGLFFAAILFVFGNQVVARFHSHEAGEVSNLTRIGVWHDAIGMWHDAPLLGHGLDSFAGIFPFYQKIQLENQIVIHPESSWLQWLTELGLIPVLIAAAAVVLFLGRHIGEIFDRQRSFFLHAGGFAAFGVLLIHAIFDVPAHRWGTAGFALAALALACPMRAESRRTQEPRKAALVPLAVGAFWLLPIYWNVPAWSPLCLNRLIELNAHAPSLMPLAVLQNTLHYFPLNADLHQAVGLRELRMAGPENALPKSVLPAVIESKKPAVAQPLAIHAISATKAGDAAPAGAARTVSVPKTSPSPMAVPITTSWQRHFGVASRLQPSNWEMPIAQARACERVVPGLAFGYWEQAIDRGGIHRDEILGMAVQETAKSPMAQSAWGSYVEAHPQLLLAYAQVVPETFGAYYYGRWWKLRADADDLTADELKSFYALVARWGNRDDFDAWAKRHAAIGARDYQQWAGLYHVWGDDDHAWQLLSIKQSEPAFPPGEPTTPRAVLENTWRTRPENVVNAQQLAQVLLQAGEKSASDDIIVTVASSENPPPWFVNKAAWILARNGRAGDAVDLLLRPH
ncbi:O-antigen polymerase [Chthoniobacter flavus Ellin428]|uniref:O-antigen polymerase n=1 Tax=Chthoniobacter flavus Ellin428 TaxID=497964 RepID=B4CW17_9BACT|nr:O-antigen ligase family protein [Chthoniobacter flavus]EDY21609.1 O-antigen polymerase [Chthoniobacter flavus Ellin428]TCO95549.1 O-antigen ligase [Chthoniobacter flavus]